jgi:hypothetical protein
MPRPRDYACSRLKLEQVLANPQSNDPRRVYWLIGMIFVVGAATLLTQCAFG